MAVGVVLGAVGAGRCVPLDGPRLLLPACAGLLVPVIALESTTPLAAPLLALVGAVGGCWWCR